MLSSCEHSNSTKHPEQDSHIEHEPVISKRWKWAAALGNVAVSIFESFAGAPSGALQASGAGSAALASDMAHNAGDAAGYFVQAETLLQRSKLSKETIRKRRMISHTIICLGSLAVAGKAGLDIALDHELSPNPLSVYAASASLALNSVLMTNLYRGIRRRNKAAHRTGMTESEKDLVKHMARVDMPSAALALGGALGQRYGVNADAALAILSGLIGGWVFRPTKANLAHDHYGEDACHIHEQESNSLRWHEKLSTQLWATGIYTKHRFNHWKEKLATRPEAVALQNNTRLRRAGLGVAATGIAVGAAAFYKFSGSSLAPEHTINPSMWPKPPLAQPIVTDYPSAAITVEPNEGWGNTFSELDIPPEQHQPLLNQVGPKLRELHYQNDVPVSYFDVDAQEWRMNASPDNMLPIEVLRTIDAHS